MISILEKNKGPFFRAWKTPYMVVLVILVLLAVAPFALIFAFIAIAAFAGLIEKHTRGTDAQPKQRTEPTRDVLTFERTEAETIQLADEARRDRWVVHPWGPDDPPARDARKLPLPNLDGVPLPPRQPSRTPVARDLGKERILVEDDTLERRPKKT